MKSIQIFSLVLFLSFSVKSQEINLIPEPVSLLKQTGFFNLKPSTAILLSNNDPELQRLGRVLGEMINTPTGYRLPIRTGTKTTVNAIVLVLEKTAFQVVGQEEGYSLDVGRNKIEIKAQTNHGIFNGLQTLAQLFPKEIGANSAQRVAWNIPSLSIQDYPRFAWRGMLLDVSRHFHNKAMVKSYLDQLAKFKFNTFHWHLSDDQGWRIEIKKYPKLTSIGAWRVPRVGKWWKRPEPEDNEATTEGGFYTQEDVKEIVQYAKERYITILPEIDVPGHSLAILAAYPELATVPKNFKVNPGSEFYRKVENSLDPSNEKTYEFLDGVFAEIAQLFPHPYIHIGGDECYKGYWEASENCKKLMAKEGLKDTKELQSFFVKKVEKILQSKGKKLIGWDEILEGGLAPDATVMSWRGTKGGIEAAKMGHNVVMTPSDFCYIDLYQGDPILEPDTYGKLRLNKAYSYEPSEGIDSKFLLGGQCNLWSENIPNKRQAEYMTYPRALATAEVFWSPKDRKNFDGFTKRVEAQFARFDVAKINYSRSMFDPIVTLVDKQIQLNTEVNGLDIYYTFERGIPDNFYPKAKNGDKISIPKGADQIRVVNYRDGKPIGRILLISIADLEKRN
jgi:hexosaminidase